MDARSRRIEFRDRAQMARKVQSEIISADNAIKKLDSVPIQDQSQLIKYRQNITVPAVWIADQGVRVGNIPMIPPEKIVELDKYIKDNISATNIEGGDLDEV